MTQQPFTVVCVYDDSRVTERIDLVENTQVLHLTADSPKDAYLKGQIEVSEATETEPIDWAVIFVCRGHHDNLNDE